MAKESKSFEKGQQDDMKVSRIGCNCRIIVTSNVGTNSVRKVDDLTDPMQAMPQEKRKKTEEEVAGEDETEANPEGLKLRKDSSGNYWAEV